MSPSYRNNALVQKVQRHLPTWRDLLTLAASVEDADPDLYFRELTALNDIEAACDHLNGSLAPAVRTPGGSILQQRGLKWFICYKEGHARELDGLEARLAVQAYVLHMRAYHQDGPLKGKSSLIEMIGPHIKVWEQHLRQAAAEDGKAMSRENERRFYAQEIRALDEIAAVHQEYLGEGRAETVDFPRMDSGDRSGLRMALRSQKDIVCVVDQVKNGAWALLEGKTERIVRPLSSIESNLVESIVRDSGVGVKLGQPDEDRRYSINEWKQAVMHDQTREGYQQWVEDQRRSSQHAQDGVAQDIACGITRYSS